ncbi:MAG: hypothetical protein AB7S26_41555 [Sandaracinaceae bacterium]
MAYRDDAEARAEAMSALRAERDEALSRLERARAALLSAVSEMSGRTPGDEMIPWRSLHGGEPVRATFVNRTSLKLALVWVSFDGREREELTMIPGGKVVLDTHAGYLYRFREVYLGRIIAQRYVRYGVDVTAD